MLDARHLPGATRADVQIFNRPSTVTNTQWQTWLKPRGVAMCNILCIGGGGGGSGGFTRAAAAAGGGGGSGGGSAVTRVTIPVAFLPDRLYVQVGAGGAGSASGSGGGAAVLSYVAIHPNTAAMNVVAVSGNAGAAGGGAASGGSPGAAGAAGTIATIANMPLAGAGQFSFIAGQIGVIGGAVAGANGTAQALPTTSVICMGGTSGAGTTSADFAGGAFTAAANTFLSEQRPATPTAGTTGAGSAGPTIWQPLFFFGGGGGSSSNAAAGAAGGPGSYGSGGGGGGAGTTGGRGGEGGSGLVIITCW